MKLIPREPPKPQSAEYQRFEALLGKVLSVSKADLRLQGEAPKKKRSDQLGSLPAILAFFPRGIRTKS